jgi:GNAT superfamily N-acetyltransferase
VVEFITRRTTADDWHSVRALRLEMLADTPIAYSDTLALAETYDESEWRMRAARGSAETSIQVVAITLDGSWIGTMGSYLDQTVGGPILVGVYVVPEYRGEKCGVTDALFVAVEGWARERSDRMWLEVHEDNARARAAYAKRGWIDTGQTRPYEHDPSRSELQLVKRLR